MEDVESGVATRDASIPDMQRAQLVRDHTAVETACQAATAALNAFFRLLSGATPADDPLVVSASSQFNMMLVGVGAVTCETLADVRAKVCVFRRLEEVLPSDDPRLRLFAHDFFRDIADFLDNADLD